VQPVRQRAYQTAIISFAGEEARLPSRGVLAPRRYLWLLGLCVSPDCPRHHL